MKNLLFFLTLISSFYAILFAQAPDTLWTRTFGGSDHDYGYSVEQTSDSGYIITGQTGSFGSSLNSLWLIKTDTNGHILWSKIFSRDDQNRGESVHQTLDGGYIIIANTAAFASSNWDLWLLKTDAEGDTIWTKNFGGSGWDQGVSGQQTNDGGFIITGVTGSDVWLIKADPNGETQWMKTFGGNGTDYGQSVWQTIDGGYIIGGITWSYGAGEADIWLIKTDANGDTLWTRIFGGSHLEYCNSVMQTSDGGFFIVGGSSSYGSGNTDVWIIKTDDNGDSLWTWISRKSVSDIGSYGQETTDGGYIVTGKIDLGPWDVWLIKTDANGDTLWTIALGGNQVDEGICVQETFDAGYIVLGSTISFGAGNRDVWLIKLAPELTGIDANPISLPNHYRLQQNHPNPFNPITTINYQLAVRHEVKLTIYNLLGQQIRTLLNEQQTAGTHQVQWDGRDESGKQVTSGIYFYQLNAGKYYSETKKMVLMR